MINRVLYIVRHFKPFVLSKITNNASFCDFVPIIYAKLYSRIAEKISKGDNCKRFKKGVSRELQKALDKELGIWPHWIAAHVCL